MTFRLLKGTVQKGEILLMMCTANLLRLKLFWTWMACSSGKKEPRPRSPLGKLPIALKRLASGKAFAKGCDFALSGSLQDVNKVPCKRSRQGNPHLRRSWLRSIIVERPMR